MRLGPGRRASGPRLTASMPSTINQARCRTTSRCRLVREICNAVSPSRSEGCSNTASCRVRKRHRRRQSAIASATHEMTQFRKRTAHDWVTRGSAGSAASRLARRASCASPSFPGTEHTTRARRRPRPDRHRAHRRRGSRSTARTSSCRRVRGTPLVSVRPKPLPSSTKDDNGPVISSPSGVDLGVATTGDEHEPVVGMIGSGTTHARSADTPCESACRAQIGLRRVSETRSADGPLKA